ncbi:MAG: hypothetical protein R2865_02170 [Deinococcales bacterium]
MKQEAIRQLGIAELALAYRQGKLKAVQVAEAYLEVVAVGSVSADHA